jgi:hypothetical protein
MLKSLSVGIDGNKINTLNVFVYHTVYGVISASADTYYFNTYTALAAVITLKRHVKILHFPILPIGQTAQKYSYIYDNIFSLFLQ